MNARLEIQELQRLFERSPNSDEFVRLRRSSKWGERIREEVIEGIVNRDPDSIKDGILFLDENPRYFRTGYFKASIASKLKRVSLTEDQRSLLRAIILRSVSSRHVGPEFSEYARLAAIISTPDFLQQVTELKNRLNGWSRNRCERVLTNCQSGNSKRDASH